MLPENELPLFERPAAATGVYILSLPVYTYTLTGHFIRYTLLVPGWTPFCLQNCLISPWHRFISVGNIPQRFWSILT